MKKFKFIATVLGFLAIWYILLTAFMPVISELASDGATEVAKSPHISEYVGAEEGLNYMPLLLYLVPGIVCVGLIVYNLKFSGNE